MCKPAVISPGHIWTTLYIYVYTGYWCYRGSIWLPCLPVFTHLLWVRKSGRSASFCVHFPSCSRAVLILSFHLCLGLLNCRFFKFPRQNPASSVGAICLDGFVLLDVTTRNNTAATHMAESLIKKYSLSCSLRLVRPFPSNRPNTTGTLYHLVTFSHICHRVSYLHLFRYHHPLTPLVM